MASIRLFTKRQGIVVFLCIGTAFLTLFFIFLTKEKNLPVVDEKYYQLALAKVHATEAVSIKGISYIVENGTVYRNGNAVVSSEAIAPLLLAYEKTAARRAPLIALPGSDPDRMDKALADLRNTQLSLANIQTDGNKSSIVKSALYPIDFLQAASVLEKTRQNFLKSGSEKDAAAYRANAIKAAQAYVDDLEKFKRGFLRAVPKDAPPYLTIKRYNSYDNFLNAIDAATKGMRGTQRTIAARTECFSGNSQSCNDADIALPSLTVSDMPTISPSMVAEANKKLELPHMQALLAATDRTQEPLMALADPQCTKDMPGVTLFLLRQAIDPSGDIYKVPTAAGNYRLVEVSTQTDQLFFSFFIQHGIRYVPNTPLVYYECLSFTSDFKKLLGIDAVRKSALIFPFSKETAGSATSLYLLEKALTSTTAPVTEHDAALYASLALQQAQTGKLSDAASSRAYELALTLIDGSSQYENQLLHISELERVNAQLYEKGLPVGLNIFSLFYTRSGFSSLFMTDNPSVSGAHETLYPSIAISTQNQPYLYYDSLPADKQQEANKDMFFYYLAHQRPSFISGFTSERQ